MGLTIIGAASLAIWTYLLFGRGGWWRESPPRLPAGSAHASVIAVIPARDEAAHIAQAVESLLSQVDQVIVVNDNSTDDTAQIARLSGAAVIDGLPLSPGWTGKLWAVAQGVEAAHSEFLLLTDADIVHAPNNVAQLLAKALDGPFDLVSLMVRLRTESLAERALIPAFVFFFLMLYPPSWIENPRRRTAGAAGGCMLIRRTSLESIGGIAAIRGELIDDCALASAVKQNGGRVWLGLAGDTRSTREYSTFAEIWSMISRTAFTQLNYSALTLAGTLAGLAITYLAPPLLALTVSGVPAILGATAWLAMSIAYAPMLRYYNRSLLWAPALPLIALFYTGATVDSALRYWSGKGGSWKGRAQTSLRTPDN